jgi:hypothetical protein
VTAVRTARTPERARGQAAGPGARLANGFHDTANATATSIATGALRPKVAVAISGAPNLAGAFLSTEVAKTISGGIVDDTLVTPGMISAGLVGAILWNLMTWLLGLPSSSSHALFGGILGAGIGRRPAEVRWGTAGQMALAWLVTLPAAAAAVGAVAAGVVVHGGTAGIVLIARAAVAVALVIVALSRRNPVHADNVNNARTTELRGPSPAGATA